MNRQEIFDTIVTHLLTQNKKSMMETEDRHGGVICAYNGKDGLKCAIGCLISDEAYDPSIEKLPVESYEISSALKKSGIIDLDYDTMRLLTTCQIIHDRRDPDLWTSLLKVVANNYELQFNPIGIAE